MTSRKKAARLEGTEKGTFFVGDSEEEGIVTILRCNPFSLINIIFPENIDSFLRT